MFSQRALKWWWHMEWRLTEAKTVEFCITSYFTASLPLLGYEQSDPEVLRHQNFCDMWFHGDIFYL
jgi:hypothetical protein